MKKPLFIYFTDSHLTTFNHTLIEQLVDRVCSLGSDTKCETLVFGGDWFDFRNEQTQQNLLFTKKMLSKLSSSFKNFFLLPGNHDKTDYESDNSFLDLYEELDLVLVRKPYSFEMGEFVLHFVPFYKEDTIYLDKLSLIKTNRGKRNLLFTHCAITGVRNNSGKVVENNLKQTKFSRFEKVIIGHYHNSQEFKNFLYPGSCYQKDFGEDDKKGIHIFYEDLSHKLVKLTGIREFKTIVVKLEVLKGDDILSLIGDNYKDYNLRVIVEGAKEEIDSFDKSKLTSLGIRVVTKITSSQTSEKLLQEVSNKVSLEDAFSTFIEGKFQKVDSKLSKRIKRLQKIISNVDSKTN